MSGVPLNDIASSNSPVGGSQDPLQAILNAIKALRMATDQPSAARAVAPLQELTGQVSGNRALLEDLERLQYLGSMNFDSRTKNTQEGDWAQVADRVAQEVQREMAQQKQAEQRAVAVQQQQPLVQQPQAQQVQIDLDPSLTRTSAQNFKQRDPNHSKKSRGNPFRVLMGQCGKLIDGGIKRSNGVSYLLRQHRFTRETIEKCWRIVEDYNQHKRAESELEGSDSDEGKKTTPTKSKDEKPADGKERSSARKVDNEPAMTSPESLYDVEPRWSTRSTAELFMRLCFLNSVRNYNKKTPQGDGRDAADTKGASRQMRVIQDELDRRGFSEEEYANLIR